MGGETSFELIQSFLKKRKIWRQGWTSRKTTQRTQKFDAGYAVMAGQVTPGKLFKGLHPDLKAIRMLAGLDRKNAETILAQSEMRSKKRESIYSMLESLWIKIWRKKV